MSGTTAGGIDYLGSAGVSGSTTTCTIYIGNDADACTAAGGTITETATDETRGFCGGNTIDKFKADSTPNPLGGTNADWATVSGAAGRRKNCTKCHQPAYMDSEVASPAGAVSKYIYASHKNASRKISPGANWAQINGVPETFSVFPDYAGRDINWVDGTIETSAGSGVYTDWYWYWGYYFEDPSDGSDIAENSVSATTGLPTTNFRACGYCHATGFAASNTPDTTKEPEKSFPGIAWDGVTTYAAGDTPGKVNLKTGFIVSSDDSLALKGTDCTGLGGVESGTGTSRVCRIPTTGITQNACVKGGTSIAGSTWAGGWIGSWSSSTGCSVTYGYNYNGWDEFGVMCAQCHNSAGGANHTSGGDRAPNPTNGYMVNAVCLQCHGKASSGTAQKSAPASAAFAASAYTTTGHPNYHGSQFMNSPHARFSGTYAQVTDSTKYSSAFTTTYGGCEGCHDPHGSVRENLLDPALMGGAVAEEGIKATCADCHGATITMINHRTGVGTPDCTICHMPGGQHLFRIAANNVTPQADGAYTDAAWIQVAGSTASRSACTQCHNGTDAIIFTAAQASAAAKGMHAGGSSTNADCLTCHAVGNTLGAPEINPGVNHHGVHSTCDECHQNGHNGTVPDKTNNDFCLTCHTNSGPYAVHHAVAGLSKTCQSCHTVPGVTVPPMTTRDEIVAGCLGCHITTQTGPGGSFAAIYPRVGTPDASQTQDNHHRGSSTRHFVSTTNDFGCKACHGSGKSTAAATGLTGAAFCAECHTVNQTTDHHAGVCLDCHKADGSFTGTFGAGVTSGQNAELDSSCLMCHSTAQGTVGAINPATVSHMTGPNTPASFAESCAKCHNANNVLASTRSYSGVAPNISATCGQCHDAANYVAAGASLKTPAELAAVADGIHDSAGVNYPVTFSASVSLKTVTTEAAVSGCGDNCASLTYDWNWGDGVTDAGAGASASHLYATGGTKTIILTAKLNGKKAGASTRNVTITTANANEPPVAAADFTFDANAWTLTVNDHSTDDNQAGLKVLVKWGDGTSKKIAPGATITHKYTRPGTFTAIVRAIDTNQKYTEVTDEVVVTKFSISGTVTAADGTTPLAGAKVQLRNPSTNAVVKTMKTLADGSFTTGQTRKPASFKVTVTKKGYTFPTTPVTVGPDADLDITANP